jgi:transcriptional regulator with XRE-family HTH domain
VIIGDRIRIIREDKKLSQGDIENRTGLLRCYCSRVENGHTVPSLETLEKFARALEIPFYQLFYEGTDSLKPLTLPEHGRQKVDSWGRAGKDSRRLRKLCSFLGRMEDSDRRLLLYMAQRMDGLRKRTKHKPKD